MDNSKEIDRKKCKKCGKPKKTVKNPLCKECYVNKNFSIYEGHSESDIILLVDKIKKWIYRMEVIQHSWIEMEDINNIITYHYDVFHSEYVCEKLSFGAQLDKMYKDLKKFVVNY